MQPEQVRAARYARREALALEPLVRVGGRVRVGLGLGLGLGFGFGFGLAARGEHRADVGGAELCRVVEHERVERLQARLAQRAARLAQEGAQLRHDGLQHRPELHVHPCARELLEGAHLVRVRARARVRVRVLVRVRVRVRVRLRFKVGYVAHHLT